MLLEVLGLNKYEYYNAPEGKDVLGKVLGFGKHSFKFSLMMGVSDVIYSQTKGVWNCLNRMAFWVIPLNAMSFTFTSLTFLSTNIRQKDDTVNYMIGSLGPTAVVQAWLKQPLMTYGALPIFMLAAVMVKELDMEHNPAPFSLSSSTDEISGSFEEPLTHYFSQPKDPRPWKN